MELPPVTRYIERRGRNLAYQACGSESRATVIHLEVTTHLDLLWTDPHFAEGVASLAEVSKVVLLQHMGVGLSDPVDRAVSLEDQASDIAAVMDAEMIASATMFGAMASSMALLILAATKPERVDALVLWNPFAQGHDNDAHDRIEGFTADEAAASSAAYAESFRHWGEGRTLDVFDPVIGPINRRRTAMLERSSATPAMAQAVYATTAVADVRAALPLVRAPVRVVFRAGGLPPEGAARVVSDTIPGATFHTLAPSHPSMSLGEAARPALDHLVEVVTGRSRAADDARRLTTMMFTDVVSSTELVAALGDARWRDLLGQHEAQIRGHVEEAGGRMVKLIGDGSLSVFPGPAAAIRAAAAIRDDARGLEIEVRAGVHTGECDNRPGGDISGLAVHIAARVGSAARPSEIWVSRAVRDFVGGSGLELEPRGIHELKGLGRDWELYALAGDDHDAPAIDPQPSPMTTADRLLVLVARRAPRLLMRVNRLDSARRNVIHRSRRGR